MSRSTKYSLQVIVCMIYTLDRQVTERYKQSTDCGQPVWVQGCWQAEAGYTFGRYTLSR